MRFYQLENCLINLDNIKYIERKTPYGYTPYYSIYFLDQDTVSITEEAYKELIACLQKNNDVIF